MARAIAIIGLGEAGGAIVEGWAGGAGSVRTYDVKSDDPAAAAAMAARCDSLNVRCCADSREAVAEADLIVCAVTADQALAAAEAAAPHLRRGAFWCDLNSCAPSSKRQAAQIIEARGGRYVDVAVMTPIYPKRNLAPLLISGPHAEAIAPILRDLPMAPTVVEGPVGAASSIKMVRSVFVKGLEALTAEWMLAATAAGVDAAVLESMAESHGGFDWGGQAAYNFERCMVHGVRRAAEMEEVAKTLADLGLPDDIVRATITWQRRLAAVNAQAPEDPRALGAKAIAETLLPELRRA